MIVLVTNRQDYTADYLILELQRRGVDFVRFNTEDYPQRISVFWEMSGNNIDGYFIFPKRKVCFREIQSVWYRRPVPPLPSPKLSDPADREFVIAESQDTLDGIWRCLDCFWVSNPDSLKRAEYKLVQLKIATQLGFEIWPTIATNIPREAKSFYERHSGKIVYKPLRRGRIYRDGKVGVIFSNPVTKDSMDQLETIKYAPVLLQRYIPKNIEIRVTVIGDKVFPVELHSQEIEEAKNDWRRGSTMQIRHMPHPLPTTVSQKCLDLVKKLKLSFGAIDLILTPDGEYIFLEINPNGQWAWIQQIIPDIPLRETLANLLIMGSSDG